MFSKEELKKLMIPLIIEQFLAVTIGLADTVMVASVGETAVSAVSLVDSINVLIINIFSALAAGGAIVASQYLGRRDKESANRAAKQLLAVVALLGTLLGAICLAANRPILLGLFGKTEESVMSNCRICFFWSAFSYPFVAVYNAGAALFRSMGNSRISMRTSIIMNAVNIAGCAVCIFLLKWGVAGAVIPALISRVLGAVIIVSMLCRLPGDIHLDGFSGFRFERPMMKNILGLGIPTGLENGMFQIGKILVQRLITSFGTIAIAAGAVTNTICMLPQIPAMAIGLGMVTVVGRCVGAGQYDEAARYTKKLTLLANLTMVVLCLVLFLLEGPVVTLFGLSAETAMMAKQLITSYCIAASVLWSMAFAFPNGLRAAGDVKYTMTVSVISMWVFRIGCSYLLTRCFGFGILGVWLAMYIDWMVRGAFFALRFAGGKWKEIGTVK